MKTYAWILAASLLLAACTEESKPVEEETPVTSEEIEDTETTDEDEAAAADQAEEDAASEDAEGNVEELVWDQEILSQEGKNRLLSGQIIRTDLAIGSTLDEVEAELGTPEAEEFLAGAPLKSYGNIHIAHLTDEEEVVAFHLSFDEPVSIDALHEAWGEPTDIAPMEIDDMIEAHSYEGDGYVAVFTLTSSSPEAFYSVHVSKLTEE